MRRKILSVTIDQSSYDKIAHIKNKSELIRNLIDNYIYEGEMVPEKIEEYSLIGDTI
jgi:hypothetical protein